jgi:hypothetical protein
MNRLHFGLSILSLFSLVACVQVKTISCGNCDAPPLPQVTPEQPNILPTQLPATFYRGPNLAQLCQLNPPIAPFQKQENSSWCWAASTTLVMNHLEPQSSLKQCDVVQKSLAPEIRQYVVKELTTNGRTDVPIDCCSVTDQIIKSSTALTQLQRDSLGVCITTFRPERALEALGYSFELAQWPADSTDPQGLTWDQLTGQICDNRPFISVKLWDEGGTHAEVVTGYHLDPNEMKMVDLESAGMDGFHSDPFKNYQGKPGDYVHVRDYYDIGLIGR